MGSVRMEFYAKSKRLSAQGDGEIAPGGPLKVATETSSTTATTAGSRVQLTGTGINTNANYFVSLVVDEDCLVAIGADPTAAVAPANSYLLKANVARELPIKGGDKLSFKDVA